MIKIKKYQIEDYISDATQDALDLKADLVNGKVPASQLPSFVDDVIEVANYAALPIPGATGVIYITLDTNKVYRWTGSVYVEIASGVTNLSYTPGVSNGTVNSDTGSDAIIPLAGTVNAGLFSAAEKSKLDSLELQNLQEVVNIGNSISNYGGIGTASIQSTNFSNNRTLYLNNNSHPTIKLEDNLDGNHYTVIDIDTLNLSGVSYPWSSIVGGSQNLQEVTDEGATTTNAITAQKFIKEGGFDFQFLKADGSVDNNTYLTSADLPSTLDLYATTSPDPVISGYTALVRNITDTRYNTVAVDVPTPLVNGTIASPTFCGAVISDPSVLLGNPGVFNFTVIGNIRRVSGSTSSGADFFYGIYKRDLAGTETFIADSAKVPVPANGGLYVEYISTALWNDGIFLSTDRIVLKFYGIQTGGGTGAYYEFLFGGDDPVRGTASISSAIIPNIYLRDLADVEKVPALNNEVLYWNDPASLWEHSLVVDLTPDANATQRGLVSIGAQTFAGSKTFSSQTILGDGIIGATQYGLTPQVTVGSATGGVLDIRNTSTNIVAGNTVGTLQFSAKDDESVAYSNAQIKVITNTNIGTGSAGQTDMIFYTSSGSTGSSPTEKMRLNNLGLLLTNETASTIASFDADKVVRSLSTTIYPSLTELSYVKGVTNAIQTQLNGKAPLASPTFTGTVVLPSTTSIGTVSSTEIGYLDNVTSNIQDQFSGKQPLATNLTSLAGLTYSAPAFVKMTSAGTFTLDTSGGGGVTTFSGGTTGLTPNTATSGAVTLAGTLNILNGGTGATTAPQARINLGGSTLGINIFTAASPSAITFLRINADNTPSYLDAPSFRTAIGIGTVVTSLSTIGTAATANTNGATITGSVLNLEPASASFGGVVTTGVQTIAGVKTFNSSPLAPTPAIGVSNTTVATTQFVSDSINAATPGTGYGVFNILITSTSPITTITSGTSNSASYSQNGRNVMIQNSSTNITITVDPTTPTDFIASYTKLSVSGVTITFQTTNITTWEAPNGYVLNGRAGSTALLTRNGTSAFLLINNIL